MLFLLIIPALLLIYYYYRTTIPEITRARKVLLFSLRTVAVIILLLLLFNPIFNYTRTVTIHPVMVLLSDNSYSMDLQAGEKTKLELMESFREILANEMKQKDYDLVLYDFADGIEGSRTRTDMTNTLQALAEKENLQNVENIVLFSDGWFNDPQLDIINRLNIPIWTVRPEYEVDEFDLGINTLFYNPTAYTEDENYIIADLYAENYEEEAELSLYINEKLIEQMTVDFSEDNIQQITFEHIFDEAGLYPIRVEIEAPGTEEFNLGNNLYPGAIRVLDKRSGVYILTDVLNWDVMFLKAALRRDDRKDVQVFRSQNNTFYSGRESFPFRDIFPDHLQMLILINQGNLSFNTEQIELLDRFIGNGGGLLFLGKPLPELSEILALKPSGIERTFRNTLYFTPESRKYQTFSDLNHNNIPALDLLYVEPLLHAEILARFNNEEQSPAIIFSEYRQGRVICFALFNLWRWQLRGEGREYNDFITNLSSWLSNPTESSFIAMTDKNSYFLGEPVNIRLTAYDETLAIHQGLNPKILLFDEEERELLEEFLVFDSRYYSLDIRQLPAGEFNYEISDDITGNRTEGSFIVSDIDAERRNRGFNFPLLSFISRQTGGNVLDEEAITEIDLERAIPATERQRLEIPLYRHWLIIALFLLAFCVELYLRKKWGLL